MFSSTAEQVVLAFGHGGFEEKHGVLQRQGGRMFNYPLLSGHDTTYARLGVSPDATAGEIREAKAGMIGGLTRRKHDIERRLAEVYAKIPDLNLKRRELQQALEQSDEKRRQALTEQCRRLEANAARQAPDFADLEREGRQIDERISELNNIRLEMAEERARYDSATPPCALLKLATYELQVVTQPRVKLHNVRSSLATFLEEEKGSACFHPSDLTRRNFHTDYEQHPLLDRD